MISIKQITTVVLILSFLLLTGEIAFAEKIEVENEVILVAENRLVELSAQKKFNDLVMIMKEMVKRELKDKEDIKLEQVTISNFELIPEQGFKIYYNLK